MLSPPDLIGLKRILDLDLDKNNSDCIKDYTRIKAIVIFLSFIYVDIELNSYSMSSYIVLRKSLKSHASYVNLPWSLF